MLQEDLTSRLARKIQELTDTTETATRRTPAEWLAILGPLVLAAYFLASTKWGSYLLPGPPYIGDLAIIVLIVNRALLLAGRSAPWGQRDVTIAIVAGLLLMWATARIATGEYSADAARDAAPYMYVILAFLVVPLDSRAESVASKILTGALLFHLAWCTVTVVFGKLPFAPSFPWAPRADELSSGTYIFSLRPDIDAPVIGLLISLCIYRALVGRQPTINLLIAAWGFLVVAAGLASRAGFLAVVLQMIIIVMLARRRSRDREASTDTTGGRALRLGDPRITVAILLLALPFAFVVIRDSPVANAVPLALDPYKARPFETNDGAGTARARIQAWNRTLSWVQQDPGRLVAGTGFGPNYFFTTGSSRLLSSTGNSDVRSPHNYWLNSWARLGLIGVIIVLLIPLAALRLAVLIVRAPSRTLRETDLIAILTALSMPIAASVGVLLESPFGAIPYFWAIGHLSVRAVQLGVAEPIRLRD